MAYDPSFINEIVEAYEAGRPTVENSQQLVRQISEQKKLPVAKVRAILVSQKVYLSQPKVKTEIDPANVNELLHAFEHFTADDDGSYSFEMARYRFVEVLRKSLGYTSSALEDFAKKASIWPLSNAELEREAIWRAEATAHQGEHRQDTDEIVGRWGGSSIKSGGPDGCGWFFVIVLSLLLVTCISNANPDEGKSDLQRKADVLCDAMGGCR